METDVSVDGAPIAQATFGSKWLVCLSDSGSIGDDLQAAHAGPGLAYTSSLPSFRGAGGTQRARVAAGPDLHTQCPTDLNAIFITVGPLAAAHSQVIRGWTTSIQRVGGRAKHLADTPRDGIERAFEVVGECLCTAGGRVAPTPAVAG